MSNIGTPTTDIKDRVYTLYTELVNAKKDKKEASKMHSENVKRIEEEIKELLDQEEEAVSSAQKAAE